MIVVVIVPALGAPSLGIFVPPTMAMIPAPRAGGIQAFARLRGLGTVPAMLGGSFVQLVVSVNDAILTIFRAQLWRGIKCQRTGENGSTQQRFAERRKFPAKLHLFSSLELGEPA
jgi:hypothetical protein